MQILRKEKKMKHDYKQALEVFQDWLDNDLGGIKVCFHADAIRSALELAIALQPKPISEAPKDGTPILAYSETRGLESPVQWGRYERFDLNGYSGAISNYVYYYDLSALPKVEETNED